MRRDLSSCVPSATLDGNGMSTCTWARGSSRFLLFALDNLVFAIIGGGKAVGGADSSGVGGIGVGSTHSSSSRSLEADEVVLDEKGRLVMCDGSGRAGGGPGRYRDRTDGVVSGATAAAALAALGGCT